MRQIDDGVDGLSLITTPGSVLPPPPPPYPATMTSGERTKGSAPSSSPGGDLLSDRLFDQGYRADVKIYSSSGVIIDALMLISS
ncbi:hypothetical protein MLD38_028549 [Melastoma candidum]|uniref:Uncharacterized protein n=1 Tax=Melastoma candidum TaxID=119954 RepID=A0ACB9N3K5_9MYRT|nr:hypothetical protein MLD38_028549 [Melastoma candidum]